MSFEAQSEKLRQAAKIWSECATDTQQVHGDLLPAVGQGDKFGVLAGSSGVKENYNIWIQDMANAAKTGAENFAWLSAALNAVADTYDSSDATVAQSIAALNRMI